MAPKFGVLGAYKPTCCLIAGGVTLLWAIWSTHLYQRFTPVYTALVCRPGPVKMHNLKLGLVGVSPTTFTLFVTTNCTNPNPYTINFIAADPGDVFMTHKRLRVGSAMDDPDIPSVLPEDGNGSITTEVNVEITAKTFGVGGPIFFSREGVPLFLELNQEMRIDVHFFFGSWSVRKWLHKKCAMMISSLTTMMQHSDNAGPMVCKSNFDDIDIPPLTSSGSKDMVMEGDAMSPQELAQGALAKNIGLGVTMAILYPLAAFLIVRSCFLFAEAAKRRRQRKKERKAREGAPLRNVAGAESGSESDSGATI